MADRSSASRTYPPTTRRLRLLRGHGDVARSRDFVGVAVLVAAAAGLGTAGVHATDRLAVLMRETCTNAAAGGDVWAVLRQGTAVGAELVGIFFGIVFAAAALATVVQVGPRFAAAAVAPDFGRLRPGAVRSEPLSLARVLLGMAKALVIAVAVAWICARLLRGQSQSFAYAVSHPPAAIGQFAFALVMAAAGPLLAVLAVLAVIHVLYVKWAWWARQRMTREEVLADFRAEQGDSRLRRARQRRHRELAQ